VPTSPKPAEDAPPNGPMPTSVRVAVGLMAVLAALLVLNGAVLWYGYDGAVDRIVREGNGISRADARQYVTLSLVPYLVIGLVLALAAFFLPRRQAWARWIGLAASFLLALLALFSILAAGGITVASLLLLVLSSSAVTSLLARTTRTWVPSLRSRA
jgi:hypothetical protein